MRIHLAEVSVMELHGRNAYGRLYAKKKEEAMTSNVGCDEKAKLLQRQHETLFPKNNPSSGSAVKRMQFDRFSVYKPINLTYTAGTAKR